MHNESQRILSAPYPVHWAGFRSTTTEMQQHGWQLAVEYDVYRQGYRLLFRHEQLRLYALTMQETIQQQQHSFTQMNSLPPFRVQHVAANIEFLRLHDDLSNFQAIDATPVYTERKIERLEDLNIFNVSLRKAEEILVDEANMEVIDHLQAIKELQSEEQRKIRERMLRGPQEGTVEEVGGPVAHVMANVISIAA